MQLRLPCQPGGYIALRQRNELEQRIEIPLPGRINPRFEVTRTRVPHPFGVIRRGYVAYWVPKVDSESQQSLHPLWLGIGHMTNNGELRRL